MPYTGIVLTFVALHAAAFLILLGHWLVTAGMFPRAAQSFVDVYETRPVRATLIGIFTYGLLVVLLISPGFMPAGKGLLVILWIASLLIGFIGSTGLALRIGRNLSATADTWQHGLRGGTMLALVFITPVLGSLFLLHLGIASGFGAVLLARPWKSKVAVPAATPVPVETSVSAPVASLS